MFKQYSKSSEGTSVKGTVKAMNTMLLCFVLLAFPYLVCTAMIYLQEALDLSIFAASLFPAMVFMWPLILSFPAEYVTEKLGSKN